MGRKIRARMIACGVALGLAPAAAWAQLGEPMLPVPALPVAPNVPIAPGVPLERGLTVVDRARPEVAPLGMRLGSWFFFPRAEVAEIYNDNIFATTTGKQHDFITALAPGFDLRSNFPQNALNLSGGAIISWYKRNSAFNTQDAFGAMDGRIDVDAAHDIHGGLRAARSHWDPGNPNFPGAAAGPVIYNTYTGNVGFAQTRLRIGYSADFTAERNEFQAVPTTGGGLLPESDNNSNDYQGTLRAYYEFVPNYQAFVRGSYDKRDYDHPPLGAPTRDSQGYRADVGARIDLTGITYTEFYVGYLRRLYSTSAFGSAGGIDVGANLVWNATQLTSVTLKGLRTVQDANPTAIGTTTASPAYVHSTAGLSVDHELLRNVLINANVAYANDDFKGVPRTDNDYLVGTGVKYLLNRNLYLGGTYVYERRYSTGAAAINAFSRNIFMLRVSTQL